MTTGLRSQETAIALNTSVAIPLLVTSHAAHTDVVRWWDGRPVALSGHALAETYSVLTRLPGDARLTPADAARLLDARFEPVLLLGPDTASRLPSVLSTKGIAGGAVYDAMIGLAAVEHDRPLATRDGRAKGTYEAVGARVMPSYKGIPAQEVGELGLWPHRYDSAPEVMNTPRRANEMGLFTSASACSDLRPDTNHQVSRNRHGSFTHGGAG